ncbi:MAG TPA: hypothetical protein VKP30_06605 [Polyangiaceae bacterium]|nr:hypothetical protein [Polyangiaceae bacterium]
MNERVLEHGFGAAPRWRAGDVSSTVFGRRWEQRLFELAAARHARRRQKRLATIAASQAGIRASAEGLCFPKPATVGVIPWGDIVQVEFEREENPWGDPQFGSYSDCMWWLTTEDPPPAMGIARWTRLS